jgi:hypothetical protein
VIGLNSNVMIDPSGIVPVSSHPYINIDLAFKSIGHFNYCVTLLKVIVHTVNSFGIYTVEGYSRTNEGTGSIMFAVVYLIV